MGDCIAGYKAFFSIDGSEVGLCRDTTLDVELNLADSSVREDNGWWGRCPTLAGITASGEAMFVASNAGVKAIRNAQANRTKVAAVFLDQSGGNGYSCSGYFGTITVGQEIDDVQTLGFNFESDGVVTIVGAS